MLTASVYLPESLTVSTVLLWQELVPVHMLLLMTPSPAPSLQLAQHVGRRTIRV